VAKTCPKCHSENTDTARFCSNCATALGAPPKAKPFLTKTVEKPAEDLVPGFVIGKEYEIIEKLGRGGMGEVYRALDRHLDRQVAVKVLPEEFGADPERLARFRREAKLLASLTHPNIAAVHELEESGDRRFLILELVEGETLQARLDRGAMPVEEALETCRQVAAGLEAAHEKGIVHRDLKPGNIMVTPDGQAKILDFGLAKAEGADTTGVDIANSPTITAQMTEPGIILGTAAYMSPEQARGRTVDKRADIWAFGCVLYECLTGKRAFLGETTSDTIAQILKGEPDWSALPAATPACVRSLLSRCLKKDRKERLRDIGDARLEIEEVGARPIEAADVSRRLPLLWMAGAAVVMLLSGFLIDRFVIRRPRSALSTSVIMSTIKVEPGHRLEGQARDMERPGRTAVTISSDGKFIVYSAIEEDPAPQAKPQLYLRRMDQSAAKPIAGTEGGISPFLSPDSRWVGFWADGKVKKVLVAGGVPSILCDASALSGANWGRDNSIVFADGWGTGLSRVSAEGGKPETLTKPDRKREEWSHSLPSWLPNGKAVLFTVPKYWLDLKPRLALLRLDTGEWHVLFEDAADARYIPTGHLVFLRQGTLMAVRFDLAKMEAIGQPVALLENVMQALRLTAVNHTGGGQLGISDTGSLIYAPGGVPPLPNNSLVWVDQRGIEQPAAALQFPFSAPRLSPDGQRVAYTAESQVYVYDLGRGTNSRLTDEGRAVRTIWTPDGKRLLFSWGRSAANNLFWQPYDGSSPMERLTTSEHGQQPGSWSSDGKTLAFEDAEDTGDDIAFLDVRSGRVTPFLNSKYAEWYPEFSPDGLWMAYASDESGRQEIYVRPFPGPGMKQQVSSDGGSEPLWARNGKQLFYRRLDQVWVVDVRTDGGLTGKPRLLFEKPGYSRSYPIRSWDLSLDGQRFLMVRFENRKPTPVTEMTLVLNWFEELKRLVPAK
jgi:Tol biopolymer transport system component